ncbi:MAG: tRNA pseudouridine(54/55) synthase Pus10 [Candidatus Methanospirare jalkutatii]|nr:tRNA pseudouridine(54/55) synthase Pus10 [Candidatus Methanospirare jalkutatii]
MRSGREVEGMPKAVKAVEEAFKRPEILNKALKIIQSFGNGRQICDNCLGRQFAKIGAGISNSERGRILRNLLRSAAENVNEQEEKCFVCNGIFERLDDFVQKALSKLREYEFNTFLVGTKVSGMLSASEEMLWDIAGAEYAEPLKAELNREVGKRISRITGKIVDFKRPDIVILLNLWTDDVELQVNSLFIYGRYRKLVRGIPQTRWPCKKCWGKGCERCNYTGKMYAESVEELIRDAVLEDFKAEDMILHGAGREDIDARMLGSGRPFVVEVKVPRRRNLDLSEVERRINERCAGKVEVFCLRFVPADFVERVKQARAEKTYRAKVLVEGVFSEDEIRSALQGICGKIEQRTPLRVLHRRADLVRVREVKSAKLLRVEHLNGAEEAAVVEEERERREKADEQAEKQEVRTISEIELRCEGGLYVKELVSGDEGRTKPSLSEILGARAYVLELDVMDVHLFFGDEECVREKMRE